MVNSSSEKRNICAENLEEINKEEFDNNVNIEKKVEPIKLFPYQVEHFERVMEILTTSLAVLNNSCCGSGKTITTLAIAATYKMGILVIGPKSVLSNWQRKAEKYGIHVFSLMSYATLRGTAKNGVKHGFLIRDGDVFTPTNMLEECAKYGLLIVYDECHALKNENSQLYAAHAISKEAVRLAQMGYNIRIACLSATPCDKKENVTSLFKIMGILVSDELYKYDRSSKTYKLTGLQDAITKAKRYDPETTFHATCRAVNKSTIKLICHDLYTRVLKKHISSSMPKPPIKAKQTVKNFYAIMPKEDLERMKEGAMMFSSSTNYNFENKTVDLSKTNWGDVVNSRRLIDSAKLPTMVRLAKQRLDENPNRKVILYMTYIRDMEKAAELLKRYNALLLNGNIVRNEDRDNILEKFQRGDNKYRVLISNPKVGGQGLDIDDIYGNFPRTTIMLPSYFFVDQYQSTYRTLRQTSLSDSEVLFLYSRECNFENNLLNSIASKSLVVRDMINSEQGMMLPSEYEEEIELTPEEIIQQQREMEGYEE